MAEHCKNDKQGVFTLTFFSGPDLVKLVYFGAISIKLS